ncbi:hypothetical protein WN51_14153 [Melipona quadrifasciata]|uniref:Uncharacterized protein n=1 Tax=Melipona quadrifasciata TaxID=166423 RepID=A0A0M9A1M9_9HYME|nr:hypothetical protein WN51_14153 [Melipona quadrifasciata]
MFKRSNLERLKNTVAAEDSSNTGFEHSTSTSKSYRSSTLSSSVRNPARMGGPALVGLVTTQASGVRSRSAISPTDESLGKRGKYFYDYTSEKLDEQWAICKMENHKNRVRIGSRILSNEVRVFEKISVSQNSEKLDGILRIARTTIAILFADQVHCQGISIVRIESNNETDIEFSEFNFVTGTLKGKDLTISSVRLAQIRPRIPQIRVSNTRLAQAASGCAPSVDVLPIFDVKQQSVRNAARMGGTKPIITFEFILMQSDIVPHLSLLDHVVYLK